MHDDKKLISIGLTVFACSVILTVLVLNAWGQIRGTFKYVPPSELIDLVKWLLSFAAGIGTVGGVTAAIVSLRSGKDDDEGK